MVGQWEVLRINNNYEIYNEYPYPIRKLSNGKILRETTHKSNGYVVCTIGKKTYYKHRIIALQWIDNPKDLPQIDHINHNKSDNNISNLRWVNQSENNKNKSRHFYDYEYFDDIPNDSIEVDTYGEHRIHDVYYYDDEFYYYNGLKYRKLHICKTKSGKAFVNVVDDDGKIRHIFISIFKKQYGLL